MNVESEIYEGIFLIVKRGVYFFAIAETHNSARFERICCPDFATRTLSDSMT